jgi:ABC-2 type transport system ATP-binding protein
VAAAGVAAVALTPGSTSASVHVRSLMLPVTDGPAHDQHVLIDLSLFVPAGAGPSHRAPAVVLGHGFGGDKNDERADAENLARHGYVVLTPSARGFGASTGRIGLDLPAYDGTDLRAEIDYLAAQPEVLLDHPNDPRVGLAGVSYGGGLALSGATVDPRVDVAAGIITWNSLASALLPNAADPADGASGDDPGVFKALYAGAFFGSGATRPGQPADPCGRFVPEVCTAYAKAGAPAGPATGTAALMAQAGVGSRIGRLRVPTLLIQGESDTLFPLSEAVRTYTALRSAGVPTAMVWSTGGHDQPFDTGETQRIRSRTIQWFDTYLRHDGGTGGPGFSWDEPQTSQPATAAAFPVPGTSTSHLVLGAHGVLTAQGAPGTQQLVNPPGGHPAGFSSLPGLGDLGDLVGRVAQDPPNETATWTSEPLKAPLNLVGIPTVRVHVTSTSGTAVLFAKLYDVDDTGTAVLPHGQVAPLRVSALSPSGRDATVRLPALAHTFAGGHRIRLAFASTDSAYTLAPAPAVITVGGLSGSTLALPAVPAPRGRTSGLLIGLAVAALVALALCAGGLLLTRRNRRAAATHLGDPQATPVVVRGLTKTYRDGNRAVDDVSFTVERGQVVGLLGPNGAGKTTTLRMLLGLIRPSDGDAVLYGERIRPGSPVLARLGTFVEGPGLLPHLTGRDNLRLWWRSTGADLADARMEEALEIAGLGGAIEKPVRTYSHGMKQRLALAQALLGMPDCLVLDEPTNGLDPPQIREMRELIQRYAATGRTVLLSSHLLAEVEVTCTHAVVMQSGRLIYRGSVADLLGRSSSITLMVRGDPDFAASVLRGVDGVGRVDIDEGADRRLVIEANPLVRSALVRALVAADVDVEELAIQRRLEDVFLNLVGADVSGHAVGSGGRIADTAYGRGLSATRQD